MRINMKVAVYWCGYSFCFLIYIRKFSPAVPDLGGQDPSIGSQDKSGRSGDD